MAEAEGAGRKTIALRAHFKAFAPRADDAEGHCLWCGRRLPTPTSRPPAVPEDAMGGYWDNAFCGLRCGYSFGVTCARLGHRLARRPR